MKSDISLQQQARVRIPTPSGVFQLCLYQNDYDHKDHLSLVMGDIGDGEDVLVRVHSECFTGDVLGSRRCDCGEQLQRSMEIISSEGRGAILYMRQEGRGIGLLDKLRAYNLQDEGYDTVDANLLLGHQADERDYTVAALILHDLGVRSVRLLTNNPTKVDSIRDFGVHVNSREPLQVPPNADNAAYLVAKATRMNHLIDFSESLDFDTGNNGNGGSPR